MKKINLKNLSAVLAAVISLLYIFGFSGINKLSSIKVKPQLIGKMQEQRASFTATLLPNGKVLIAGGFKKGKDGYSQIYFNDAEIYDPAEKTFREIGKMHDYRCSHHAVLLKNGDVLILGGYDGKGSTASAEIFDPKTEMFTKINKMNEPRVSFTATLLNDGRVLIAGGKSAEIFNPSDNSFSEIKTSGIDRGGHQAVLLKNGKVLIAGGSRGRDRVLANAKIFDPRTNSFSETGRMNIPRRKFAAVLLNNGNVLVMGGSDKNDWQNQFSSAEIYNVKTGTFNPAANMNAKRFKFYSSVVEFKKGNIIICGGNRLIEMFDQTANQFKRLGEMDNPYYFSSAVLLNNDSILILGGYTDKIKVTDNAWLLKL